MILPHFKDLHDIYFGGPTFELIIVVPTEKLPRMLTSSASAMKKLIRKAELLGIYIQVGFYIVYTNIIQNVDK